MISIDGGDPVRGTTFATWASGGRLIGCGPWYEIPVYGMSRRCGPHKVVIESQVIYPQRGKFRTKNPASIIKLSQRAGAIAGVLTGVVESPDVEWILPRSWKGGTKKPTSAKNWASYVIHRLVMIALDAEETNVYLAALIQFPDGEKHNLADGVGLGLWKLGRLSCKTA